jgi:hypothetical protein
LLLTKEEGDRSDKPPKAHAPEMSHEMLSPRNPATKQQAHIPSRAQQGQDTEEKVPSGGTLTVYGHSATRYLDSPDKPDS